MIDRKEVEYVARLARLNLTEEEKERMTRDLTDVLDHIREIEKLDLDGVPPTTHVQKLENVLREDVVRPGLSRDQALENAPEIADGGFAVPTPGS